MLALTAFTARLYYLFRSTAYKTFLFDDPKSYWDNAVLIAENRPPNFYLYHLFPTFYSLFLAGLHRLLHGFHLDAWKLEISLGFQALLVSAAGYFVYRIAAAVLKSHWAAMGASAAFLFSYPAVFMNSLVMPDNFSVPAVIAACWLLLFPAQTLLTSAAAGILFGAAAAAKPSFLLMGIVFAGWILLIKDTRRLARVFCFCLCCAAVLAGTVLFNRNISGGKLTALGANGGINFFQAYCRPSLVRSKSAEGGSWVRAPLAIGQKKEEFVTDVPFYKQSYFYREGLACIRREPNVLWERAPLIKEFISGRFIPEPFAKPLGFDWGMRIHRLALTVCLGSVLLYVFIPFTRDRRKMLFLLGIAGVYLATICLLSTPERRYFFPAEFVLYTAFFGLFPSIGAARKRSTP